jgi:hypothetical protein
MGGHDRSPLRRGPFVFREKSGMQAVSRERCPRGADLRVLLQSVLDAVRATYPVSAGDEECDREMESVASESFGRS